MATEKEQPRSKRTDAKPSPESHTDSWKLYRQASCRYTKSVREAQDAACRSRNEQYRTYVGEVEKVYLEVRRPLAEAYAGYWLSLWNSTQEEGLLRSGEAYLQYLRTYMDVGSSDEAREKLDRLGEDYARSANAVEQELCTLLEKAYAVYLQDLQSL